MKKLIVIILSLVLSISVFAQNLNYKMLIGSTWVADYTIFNTKKKEKVVFHTEMIFLTSNKVIYRESFKSKNSSGASEEFYGYKMHESEPNTLVVCIDYTDNCTIFKYKNNSLVNEDFKNIVFKKKK